MDRSLRTLLFLFFISLFLSSAAFAQTGFLVRPDCTTLTPATGQTACHDSTNNVLRIWTGTAWQTVTFNATGTYTPNATFSATADHTGTITVPRKVDPASPTIGELWVNLGSIKVRDNAGTPATRELVTLDAAQTITGNKTFSGSPGVSFSVLGADPACGTGQYFLYAFSGVSKLKKCENGVASTIGGIAAEVDTLQTVFDRGKTVTDANSATNAMSIGDSTRQTIIYGDPTLGAVIDCLISSVQGACNKYTKLNAGFESGFLNSASTKFFTVIPEPTTVASTEAVDFNFRNNRTLNFPTGALTTQRWTLFNQPTISFTGASTVTDTATVAIAGAPVAGTNATITNPWALWVQAGNVRLASTRFDIGNVSYTWPSAQGAANTFAKNDGSGTISWTLAKASHYLIYSCGPPIGPLTDFLFNSAGQGAACTTTDTFPNSTKQEMTRDGVLKNLRCQISTAPGIGTSRALTAMIGGVASALTCTISGTATTCQDLVNTPTSAAGNLISVRDVSTGAAAAAGLAQCSLENEFNA